MSASVGMDSHYIGALFKRLDYACVLLEELDHLDMDRQASDEL